MVGEYVVVAAVVVARDEPILPEVEVSSVTSPIPRPILLKYPLVSCATFNNLFLPNWVDSIITLLVLGR